MSETEHEAVSYEVNLPEFEGPLDLLLHLVKRHELNIVDIPIGFVTEKYLEYLDLMRGMDIDIDVAGDYLLMAATLAHIKSRELLPKRDDLDQEIEDSDDNIEDPRQELVRRLLEYQRYKDVAERLAERPALGREVYPRGVAMEKADCNDAPLAEVSVFALLSSLEDLAKRAGTKVTYDVVVDRISIADRINQIVDRLASKQMVPFFDLLREKPDAPIDRNQLVVTFLAILEMARLHMVRVMQSGDVNSTESGTIYLTRTDELRQVDSDEDSITE